MKNFALFTLGLFFGILILGGTGYGAYHYYGDTWYQAKKDADPETQLIEKYLSSQTEPLFYNLNAIDFPLAVTKTEEIFSDTWDVDNLVDNAKWCMGEAVSNNEDYFTDLIAKFTSSSDAYYKYVFTAKADQSETYQIAVLKNAPEYTALQAFKTDFNVCNGDDFAPIRMNNDWLMFESKCTTAYEEEPIGVTCQEIKDALKVEFN